MGRNWELILKDDTAYTQNELGTCDGEELGTDKLQQAMYKIP